ncbi:histidine phosphatase superfamily [Schizothecium vesticola]|uniref:Histidine phosphatase superfamily n=1 Tax=Schizothecium vesticola TaxID=314040 RepID=A0AA40F220_9PEZI|nr:histidine phosphatase superfamily [Schizothecium vesticola]
MPSTIYLIRHTESRHNVTKDFSHRDPPLTALGTAQSTALGASFPALSTVGIILVSPLTRAIETTLAAFGPLLNTKSDARNPAPKAKLILDPYLQERSALPCDTGLSATALKANFPALEAYIDEGVSGLEEEWFVKEGFLRRMMTR